MQTLTCLRQLVQQTGGQIADDAVTLAKMAGDITDGNLITYDASGDPAYVATGAATEVLTSNGAGAAPTFQAANSWWGNTRKPVEIALLGTLLLVLVPKSLLILKTVNCSSTYNINSISDK